MATGGRDFAEARLVFALVVLGLLAAPAAAGYSLIAGLEQYTHLVGTNATIKGKLVSDSSVLFPVTNQDVSLWFGATQQGTATTGNDGSFSKEVPVPGAAGLYTFQARFDTVLSAPVEFRVANPSEPQTFQGALALSGDFVPMPLASAGHGITAAQDSGLTLGPDTRGACSPPLVGGASVCVIVNTTSRVAHLSLDGNTVLNGAGSNDTLNVESGSRVRIGGQTWELRFYPSGSLLLLLRPAPATMTSLSSTFTILAVALDAFGNNTSAGGVEMRVVSDAGGTVLSPTAMVGAGVVGLFGASPAQLNPASLQDGLYHIVFNNTSILSFSIANTRASGAVLDAETGSPRFTFAPGSSLILSLSLVNQTTGNATTGATASANISGASYPLTFDNNTSAYRTTLTASSTPGTYDVTFLASAGGRTYTAYARFEVSSYDLFLIPVSKESDRMSVFAPGGRGYLVVAGHNLSDGSPARVDNLTLSNKSNFTFVLLNDTGGAETVDWNVSNLSKFFSDVGAPDFLRSGLTGQAPNGSVVNFSLPTKTGIYRAQVGIQIQPGVWESAETAVPVQRLFVSGFPVDSGGGFSFLASPRANVTLRINAWDPKNFKSLCVSDIHGAGLIEAFNDSGELVTDKMENAALVSLASYPGDPCPGKGLRFFNNDTSFGFHRVRFWINATVDGELTRAAGEGWFDVRAYFAWAQPADWRAFGSTSNITLQVNVRDTSFNVPSSPVLATVNEVRFSENFQKISINGSSPAPSCSTDTTNGRCSLTLDPDSALSSGSYNVRLRLTGPDPSDPNQTVTDSGWGWFEVRNFYFSLWPNQWEVRPGGTINFTYQANNVSNWASLNLGSLTLRKVIYHGEKYGSSSVAWEGNEDCLDPANARCRAYPQGTPRPYVSVNATGITTQSGAYEFVFEGGV